MKRFFAKFKQPKVYVSVIVVIIIAILFMVNLGNGNGKEHFDVVKKDIVQTVSVTGKTKASSYVDLSFERSGRVTQVNLDAGDRVVRGQVIVRLDSSELYASLLQSKANLDAENVRLLEIEKGTRPEELRVSELAYLDAQTSLSEKIEDAYTKADDAIRNQIDQLFENPRTNVAKLIIPVNDFQLETDINEGRKTIEDILKVWILNTEIEALKVKSNLSYLKSFLEIISGAVNTLEASSNITQTNIDKYKTAVSTARTLINTALSAITTAESTFNSAKSGYDLKLAGSTEETILAQKAKVAQVEAQVANIEAQMSKNVIYAPISGIVTKQEAKVGEIVSPNVNVVSIISDAQYEIEAFVPEINIGKVSVGDEILVDFDAFVGEKFSGQLKFIDPAETMINNVPNFKVKISLNSTDVRIKSGLTANVDIVTDKRTGVLTIPRYAITSEGDKYFVSKTVGGGEEKTEVTVGLMGDNADTEIISGLSEGDEVIYQN